jgi:hypothetical protein
MRFFSRKTVARGVAALSIAAALVGAGVFVGASTASAAQTNLTAGHSGDTLIVTEDNANTYSTTTWSNVTTQTFAHSISFPKYIRIRFSAETICTASVGWCSVRILVNGNEAKPVTGTDFAFDSGGNDGYEAHSMERVYDGIFGASSTVTVQAQVVSGATSLRLDDWLLDVEVLY